MRLKVLIFRPAVWLNLDKWVPVLYHIGARKPGGYRLAVRTAGSQLVNRGSIPRIPIYHGLEGQDVVS